MGTGDDEHADWEAEEMSGFIYRDFGRSCGLMVDGLLTLTGNHKQTVGKSALDGRAVTRLKLPNQWALVCVQAKARALQ